ncbi:hypothetical protein EYB26_002399 [Talaromyces marneffei]|uniref:uncharacterized protein n=1 Tax=Talaromyces marneffei TaxID=37727 RepID=UPI0012A814D5|nr:uncharacterized protein EYB26_002399 [Talaromyces marneffei]QGA14743.1 hypothetical protein EYB26_002399 [Talaromyces marneffei]
MFHSIRRALKSILGGHEDIYALDHAIINMTLPPEHMWMNMGYWKDAKSFPDACEALLVKILVTAGLISQDKTLMAERLSDTHMDGGGQQAVFKLIDVGLGCGDQSLYLTRRLHRSTNTGSDNGNVRDTTAKDQELVPLFNSYIGINITPAQVNLARHRLKAASENKSTSPTVWTSDVKIFAADAARPASWDQTLNEAIFGTGSPQSTPDTSTAPLSAKEHTWLLGLDTLYHFRPSRVPLFECAYRDMNASIMGFDLLLGDSLSLWGNLRLRLICLAAGIPYANLMTVKEYENMLTSVGYAHENIKLEDVSHHTFAGVAEFLRAKEAELNKYGMTMGRLKMPGKVFDWWAKSGAVKGYVIVAHR